MQMLDNSNSLHTWEAFMLYGLFFSWTVPIWEKEDLSAFLIDLEPDKWYGWPHSPTYVTANSNTPEQMTKTTNLLDRK
jgi:hypothetical protein